MELADEFAIIFEKHKGFNPYHKGYYHKDFVNQICKQYKEMKSKLKEDTATTKDLVDVALVEANFAAMLLDLKKTITGQEKAQVKL